MLIEKSTYMIWICHTGELVVVEGDEELPEEEVACPSESWT